MKKILLLAFISAIFSSCGFQLYSSTSSTTDGSGSSGSSSSTTTGSQGIFVWTASDLGVGYITVYLDGAYAGELTTYCTSTPTYESSCVLLVPTTVGEHSITATASDGVTTWGSKYYNVQSGLKYSEQLTSN